MFATKRDAIAYLASITTTIVAGGTGDSRPAQQRFSAWVATWDANYRTVSRASSMARDDAYLKSQVLPEFGDMKLASIRRADIQSWINRLHADGIPGRGRGIALKPSSVQKCHQVLSKILEAAVDAEQLAANPARGIKFPISEETESRFLTPDDLLSLELAMPSLRDALIVPFVADVGLRIGEACGLRWKDLNTFTGVVKVTSTVVEVRGKVETNGPKTLAGRRTIPMLTRDVGERIEALRGSNGPECFVFGNGLVPYRPSNFRARAWRPAILECGFADPQPTPHSLRHTAVAHWIAAGVDPYKIAKFAGHRSIATVYRLYGHLLDLDATDEREALSAMRSAALSRRLPGEVISLSQ